MNRIPAIEHQVSGDTNVIVFEQTIQRRDMLHHRHHQLRDLGECLDHLGERPEDLHDIESIVDPHGDKDAAKHYNHRSPYNWV